MITEKDAREWFEEGKSNGEVAFIDYGKKKGYIKRSALETLKEKCKAIIDANGDNKIIYLDISEIVCLLELSEKAIEELRGKE